MEQGQFLLRVWLWDKEGGGGNSKRQKVRQNPWLVVFKGIFYRPRLRIRVSVAPHANLSLTVKHPICPPALDSFRQWVSKAGTCVFHGRTKGHCTLQLFSLHPPPSLVTAFPKSLNIRGGVVVPRSQKPDVCCVPPSNFSKRRCQWHKQILAGERGGEEERIYSEITKHFFKAPLLLCNNLLLLFFLSLANQLPGKTQDSPINNERGKKNSSSWLEFNKSTSPSGLGLCT